MERHANLYLPYHHITEAKETCYPEETFITVCDTSARIVDINEEFLDSFNDDELLNFELSVKWGMDGSSESQKFEDEDGTHKWNEILAKVLYLLGQANSNERHRQGSATTYVSSPDRLVLLGDMPNGISELRYCDPRDPASSNFTLLRGSLLSDKIQCDRMSCFVNRTTAWSVMLLATFPASHVCAVAAHSTSSVLHCGRKCCLCWTIDDRRRLIVVVWEHGKAAQRFPERVSRSNAFSKCCVLLYLLNV